MKYLVFGLILAVVSIWSYNVGQLTPRVTGNDWRAVKAVCDYSHHINSGDWEDACGTALDATYTRYVCLAGRCWVEEKPDTSSTSKTLPVSTAPAKGYVTMTSRELQPAATSDELEVQ